MSSSQPNPDSGEKPTKSDHRAENWTPKDAADGCVTREIWVAIYTKTFEEFSSPEIQKMWKRGINEVYGWARSTEHLAWMPRRYVVHQVLKFCAFSLNLYDNNTWPKDFGPVIIQDAEKADLDDGYREWLEIAANIENENAAIFNHDPETELKKKNLTEDENPKESQDVEKEDGSDPKQENDLKRKYQADSKQEEHASANKKRKSDTEQNSQMNKNSHVENTAELEPNASNAPSAPEATNTQQPIVWSVLNRKKDLQTFNIPNWIAEAIDGGRKEREDFFQKAFLPRDEQSLPGEGFAVKVPSNVQQTSLFRSAGHIQLANRKINPALQIAWLDYEGETYLLCFHRNPNDNFKDLLDDYVMIWVGLKEYCRHLRVRPANKHVQLADWLAESFRTYGMRTIALMGLHFNKLEKDDEDRLARSLETECKVSDVPHECSPEQHDHNLWFDGLTGPKNDSS
ncbi:hypothetical protein GCG54_00006142 [Colletotrichum gloeosporioides]|uniref:Uncharacterized protein n=1 Tax=Colletotrichum gloeosporioides TaxID=474922 RepID=A0A8H4CM11_COLGL|nr:uncharacterized protein GCG54_00006142 [Colletotrichum gloeosporioides]KAF3806380.1 hypothetical protein GCG54_00006142 [Colletotrichum gloeosporioides]